MSSPSQFPAEYQYPTPPPPGQQAERIGRKIVLIVGGIATVFVLFVVGLIAAVFFAISHSEAERVALQKIQQNPAVVERFGTPIKAGMFASGSINSNGPSGSADLRVSISGPKSQGHMYLTATKKADVWTFTTLEVLPEGDEKRIDVLEKDQPKGSF